MTNKEAFQAYSPDPVHAELILESKGIDPELSDRNPESAAWGMIDSCTAADFSQGRTSEKLSAQACQLRINNAKNTLKGFGIYYTTGGNPVVSPISW